jgi:enoyl-CoA hydratase/3-hydroxyacyl-CoA dehydrogenase
MTTVYSEKSLVRYDVDRGVAVLHLQSPPVNALSKRFLEALYTNVKRAHADDNVKAIIFISAIPKFFIAGADISEIQTRQYEKSDETFVQFLTSNNDFLNLVENGPKPAVAAVDGFALGGGLEVAMSCNARIVTPTSQLGLPELTLGLIPGFGGTQRLPRLVGVKKALEMMLTTRPISANDALSSRLVDKVVTTEELLKIAHQTALDIAEGRISRRKSLQIRTRLESPQEIQQILAYTEKKLDSRQPQQKAALEAVKAGLEFDGLYGLQGEQREFIKVARTPVAKGLVHFFFAERATSKVPGLVDVKDTIKSVAVIGGGTMGSGIAIACLSAGIKVILKEVDEKFLNLGMKRITSVFEDRLQRKKITQQQHDKAVQLLSGQTDYKGFDQLDMVIEAVLEIVDLKQQVFEDLYKNCNSNCILASNTSTIDLNEIGARTKAHDRIIGLHFFSPAHIMPLLEIIRTDHTSSETLSKSLRFATQIKKTPVVVKNCVGFAVNRIFKPYHESAEMLVLRGMNPYDIDRAIVKFGFPVGPYRVSDIAGIDVNVLAKKSMQKAYGDRSYNVHLSELLVKANRLGEKTGAGFYLYPGKDRKPVEDKELLEKYVPEARKLGGNPKPLKGQENFSDEDIQQIVLFPLVNEACMVIQEKLVYKVSDIDVASTMGMGFPRFRGGLMKWADVQYGAKYIFDRLQSLYDETGIKIYKPSKYLRECAENGTSLEEGAK